MTGPSEATGSDVSWKKLPVALPLLVFVFAVGTWTKLEFGYAVAAISSGLGFVAAAAIARFIFPSVRASVRADFLKALESRRSARLLTIAVVVVLLATLTVGSVKVDSDKLAHTVDVYRVELESNGPGGATQASRHQLSAANAHQSFYVGMPFGRRVHLATSNNEVSREMKVYPWMVPTISYPGDFRPLSELAILPAPRIRLEFGDGRWLRLVVAREGTHPKILAEDTLRAFQSRVVAFDTSTVSDETARATWLPLARNSFSMDSSDTELVVTDWLLHRQVVRSPDPLLPGQQLRVILLNQKNDTLRTVVVTLSPGLSNVVLR